MKRNLIDLGTEAIMSSAPTADDSVLSLNSIPVQNGDHPRPTRHVYARGHNRWNIATFLTVASIGIGLLVYYTNFVRSDQNKEDRIGAVESDVKEVKHDVKDMGKSLSRIEGALSVKPKP